MRLSAVTMDWGGEERTFDLKLGQIRALQEKCDAGPAVILMRLQNDYWRVDDYRETLLQGLIGGGMSAIEATGLVRRWVDERPARESLKPAQLILLAWINGLPEDAPKKKEVKASKPKSKTASSPSDSSTAIPA